MPFYVPDTITLGIAPQDHPRHLRQVAGIAQCDAMPLFH